MKKVRCYAILAGFDRGRDIFKMYAKNIISQTPVDSHHKRVEWELTEEEYQELRSGFGGDISNKVKLVE